MMQKSCIEGFSDAHNPYRKKVSFILLGYNFVGINGERSALSDKIRPLELKKENIDCLRYFHGNCHSSFSYSGTVC